MRKLSFTTAYGAKYFVHENGEIERTDQAFQPTMQWRLLGLQHVQRREFIDVSKLLAGEFPEQLTYKNGNPQWTVRDWDHGAPRTWGDTKHHGIKTIVQVPS